MLNNIAYLTQSSQTYVSSYNLIDETYQLIFINYVLSYQVLYTQIISDNIENLYFGCGISSQKITKLNIINNNNLWNIYSNSLQQTHWLGGFTFYNNFLYFFGYVNNILILKHS